MHVRQLTASEWRVYQAMCSVQVLVNALTNYTAEQMMRDRAYIRRELEAALAEVNAAGEGEDGDKH